MIAAKSFGKFRLWNGAVHGAGGNRLHAVNAPQGQRHQGNGETLGRHENRKEDTTIFDERGQNSDPRYRCFQRSRYPSPSKPTHDIMSQRPKFSCPTSGGLLMRVFNRGRGVLFASVLVPVAVYLGFSIEGEHIDQRGGRFFETGKNVVTTVGRFARA